MIEVLNRKEHNADRDTYQDHRPPNMQSGSPNVLKVEVHNEAKEEKEKAW